MLVINTRHLTPVGPPVTALLLALGTLLLPAAAGAQQSAGDPGAAAEPSPDPATADQTRDSELLQTEERIAELYEQKNDYKAALEIWRKLAARDPQGRTAAGRKYLSKVSQLASELSLHEVALPAAQQLVKLEPDNASYRAQLAAALVAAKRYAEALPHLEWSIKRKPNDAELRAEVARAYETMKRSRDALVHYDWLVAREPRNVEYRLARASLYGDLDQGDKQLAELRVVRRLAPRDPKVAREIATLLVSDERFDQAEGELRGLLRLVPGDRWALAQLARIKQMRLAAERRGRKETQAAERYADWLHDIQLRAEDF